MKIVSFVFIALYGSYSAKHSIASSWKHTWRMWYFHWFMPWPPPTNIWSQRDDTHFIMRTRLRKWNASECMGYAFWSQALSLYRLLTKNQLSWAQQFSGQWTYGLIHETCISWTFKACLIWCEIPSMHATGRWLPSQILSTMRIVLWCLYRNGSMQFYHVKGIFVLAGMPVLHVQPLWTLYFNIHFPDYLLQECVDTSRRVIIVKYLPDWPFVSAQMSGRTGYSCPLLHRFIYCLFPWTWFSVYRPLARLNDPHPHSTIPVIPAYAHPKTQLFPAYPDQSLQSMPTYPTIPLTKARPPHSTDHRTYLPSLPLTTAHSYRPVHWPQPIITCCSNDNNPPLPLHWPQPILADLSLEHSPYPAQNMIHILNFTTM